MISPGFAGPRHIRILLIDAAIIGLIALGQTFVIITGRDRHIDTLDRQLRRRLSHASQRRP